jgi:transposase
MNKPERIESLLMIVVTSLFVYSATEYIIRKKLKEENKTLPNQVNKEVQNPTVRWIYSMFTNVGRMITDDKSIYVGLTDFQRRTVEILGDEWLKMYQVFLE